MHRKRVMMQPEKAVQIDTLLKRKRLRFGEPPKPTREPRVLPRAETYPGHVLPPI